MKRNLRALCLRRKLQRHVLGELGKRDGLPEEIDLARVQLCKLQELLDETLEAFRVLEADRQEAFPLIRPERPFLQGHGLQVALERGEGAAQVVGDIADQVAPHILFRAQLVDVRLNGRRHFVEAARKRAQLVPSPHDDPSAKVAALESTHRVAQGGETAREQGKKGETDDERGSERQEEGDEAGAQVVAVTDHAQGRVVAFAAEDDVDVVHLVAHAHRGRGKGAAAAGAAGIGAQGEPRALTRDEGPDGCKIHLAADDGLRGIEKIRQDFPPRIEQVDLHHGIEDHHVMDGALQLLLRKAPRDNRRDFFRDTARVSPVQELLNVVEQE